ALLVAALRRWRPLPLALAAVLLAGAWNIVPLAGGWAQAAADRSASPAVWRAPVDYLRAHLATGYRVEAVDTSQHWPALYLARAQFSRSASRACWSAYRAAARTESPSAGPRIGRPPQAASRARRAGCSGCAPGRRRQCESPSTSTPAACSTPSPARRRAARP